MQGIKIDEQLKSKIADVKAAGGSTQEVEDNLVLNNTNDTTTSVAIYGINVITTSTATDRACKLPIAETGRSVAFINNSTLPILVFPSVVGGSINGVVNGMATIPNDGAAYTFYCVENPLPGAWTWSPPATTQYDSGEIVCDTTAAGVGLYNVSISNNHAVAHDSAGTPSTYWTFDCQARDLIQAYAPDYLPVSCGDTGGVSGVALSAQPMNITKIKIYTNAYVSGTWMYAGLSISNQFSLYDSPTSPGNFVNNGTSSAGSGPNTTGETWSLVPGATLPADTVSANIGDPGTSYIIWDVSNTNWPLLGVNSSIPMFGPPQYLGPSTTPGEYIWYMGAWQFFIKPFVAFTDFKYRFIFEYN